MFLPQQLTAAIASQGAGMTGTGGPTFGPELWPQPTFASSTGLLKLASTIAGNKWTVDQSSDGANVHMATPPSFVAGETYHYSITIDVNGESLNACGLLIGGASVSLNGIGVVAGNVVIPGTPTAEMTITDGDNTGGFVVSAMSLKKLS